MKRFSTACFVRVEDEVKRKGLIQWLGSIGRVHRKVVPLDVFPSIIAYEGWHDNVSDESLTIHQKQIADLIDCGSNIDLFKALANMNETDDCDQLFIDERDGSMNLSEHKSIGINALVYRRATAMEILKFFKNQ